MGAFLTGVFSGLVLTAVLLGVSASAWLVSDVLKSRRADG